MTEHAPLEVVVPKVVASIHPEQVNSHSIWLELPASYSERGEVPIVWQTDCIQN